MKKRLGIFVFYSKSGVADLYVYESIKGILPELKKLVIVINGKITNASLQRMREYTKNIYIRANKGFDAGAYKDVFLNFLKDENWETWNEIVLMNDTFFSPIFPWNDVFERMDILEEQVDFWGLTRYVGGGTLGKVEKIPEHIQGYFLAIRKRMFCNRAFKDFWEYLEYPATYEQAVEKFEIGFYKFFKGAGFKDKTYLDLFADKLKPEYASNIYISKPLELLEEIRMPILKIKALDIYNLKKTREIIDYIEKNSEYDCDLISSRFEKLICDSTLNDLVDFRALGEFYSTHKKIFIYGHGKYGKNLGEYFKLRRWKFERFIVSNIKDETDVTNVCRYSDIMFNADDGIVLAVGRKAFAEIYPVIIEKMDRHNVFCLTYNKHI